MNKTELRKIMIDRRAAIENKADKAIAIRDNFLKFHSLSKCRNVLLYAPMKGEADTFPIAEKLYEYGCQLFYPFTKDREMGFVGVERPPKNPVTDGYGNLKKLCADDVEPAPNYSVCAIIPMLAFNNRLYRLGYGGGCYDRFLSGFSGLRVGIAFDEQYSSDFAEEEGDEPCDVIITPTRFYTGAGGAL